MFLVDTLIYKVYNHSFIKKKEQLELNKYSSELNTDILFYSKTYTNKKYVYKTIIHSIIDLTIDNIKNNQYTGLITVKNKGYVYDHYIYKLNSFESTVDWKENNLFLKTLLSDSKFLYLIEDIINQYKTEEFKSKNNVIKNKIIADNIFNLLKFVHNKYDLSKYVYISMFNLDDFSKRDLEYTFEPTLYSKLIDDIFKNKEIFSVFFEVLPENINSEENSKLFEMKIKKNLEFMNLFYANNLNIILIKKLLSFKKYDDAIDLEYLESLLYWVIKDIDSKTTKMFTEVITLIEVNNLGFYYRIYCSYYLILLFNEEKKEKTFTLKQSEKLIVLTYIQDLIEDLENNIK